jgi:uncharacterized protein YceH (UPF0502 family)
MHKVYDPMNEATDRSDLDEPTDEAAPGLPLDPPLEAEEARVLGCLIEKESATPEAYPLTQNACQTACNQKTSRVPVMKLDPGRVGSALRKLEQRGLVRSDFGARTTRFRHRVDTALELTPGQRALIGLLLLRGPQTLAELFSRTERIHRFEDLEDVEFNLGRLASRAPAFVTRLPRSPGQREDRYMHRLCGEPSTTPAAEPPGPSATAPLADQTGLIDRLEALEQRVALLEARLDPEGD